MPDMSATTGEAVVKVKEPRRFSPGKLKRLRGDRQFYVLAAEILKRTGEQVSPEVLRKYEDGSSVPGGEKLAAMAAYFGVQIDELFE